MVENGSPSCRRKKSGEGENRGNRQEEEMRGREKKGRASGF